MRQIARRLATLLLASAAAGGASGGCGSAGPAVSTATAVATGASNGAVAAATIVQAAAVAVTKIPEIVDQMVNQFLSSNRLGWGQPDKIVITDQDYIYFFPTSAADQKKNNGVPHFIMIHRTDQTDPNQRL
jgi:hypothetical protein